MCISVCNKTYILAVNYEIVETLAWRGRRVVTRFYVRCPCNKPPRPFCQHTTLQDDLPLLLIKPIVRRELGDLLVYVLVTAASAVYSSLIELFRPD